MTLPGRRCTGFEFSIREMGIEDPYAMLDELAALWAYSSMQWLRHTTPTGDTNRGRWPLSPFWQAIQQADFFGEAVPAVRERKHQGNLTLICQMLAGCSTTAAAYLAGRLPDQDDGQNFLIWFYDWLHAYLDERGLTFEGQRHSKRLRLGVSGARSRRLGRLGTIDLPRACHDKAPKLCAWRPLKWSVAVLW